jgi:STE24 endopeptidase
MALLIFSMVIGPVYLAPLFNTYTRLEEPVVRGPILGLARAQGVPSEDVWVADASRQTKRVSANVSGLLGSLRITLNDNLLHRCSLAEIESVMAHELGHYVLNHVEKSLLFFALLIAGGFAFLRLAFDRLVARFGGRWGVQGIADPAGLPLVVLLFSTWFLVTAPLVNGWIRVQEAEADLFALNAAGQPDGEARVDLMLGEYRKLDPGPLEEALLYDHPGGRSRIMMAMRWKAEHLEEARRHAERAAAEDARRGHGAASAEAWLQAHQPGPR